MVDLATRMEMAMVNTYFKKRDGHRVTYKSGRRSTQVGYIICGTAYLKELGDCKVISGDNVDKQYRMMVCIITFGDQEAEDSKGRAIYKMVEIEEGRRL